jgi:hypothetical protein
MNFLFRAPLFDIDPSDEEEIDEHWAQILRAISVSSSSLFKEISSVGYRQLKPNVKKKVYKYILRGRYRATPFGYFAGVGIGEFSDTPTYNLDLLEASPIDSPPISTLKNYPDNAPEGDLYLAEGGFEKWGRIHFLCYIHKHQHWGLVSLPRTKLMVFLTENLKSSNEICFDSFKKWFEDPEEGFVEGIWENLLELGILNSEARVNANKNEITPRIDLVFEKKLTIPKSVLCEIQDFGQQAGHLFIKTENPYLDHLKIWFIDIFDDRFTPLTILLKHLDFINSTFLHVAPIQNENEGIFDCPVNLWSADAVDLKEKFPFKSIERSIFDLQVVFKLNGKNTIFMENVVCNRPFVYFGRFNRQNSLFDEEKKIKEAIYQDSSVIYAELRLFETDAIESICLTKKIFEKYITPFPDPSPNAIQLEALEIGLRRDEFMLFHRESGIKIIPIVLHPLNGKEISHPLMRLLWELDHQKSYTFFPYHYSKYQENHYLPQLNWGKIVLQCRKWKVNITHFITKEKFIQWAKKSELPNPISMGYLDRELLLNWTLAIDLEILWYEMSKWKRVTLSDPIWLTNSNYTSFNNKPIYPQFVSHLSNIRNEPKNTQFVNSIKHPTPDCLYVLIRIPEDECMEFLDYFFCQELITFLKNEKIIWYYLVYPGIRHIQLRVRFLTLSRRQKTFLMTLIAKKSEESQFLYEIRPYYPEIKKYGKYDYILSEKIFHLESLLLMNKEWKHRGKEFLNDSGNRIELIIELWMEIIDNINMALPCFIYSKKKIKSLSIGELKQLRNVWGSLGIPQIILTPYRAWMNSYWKIISTHSSLNNEGEGILLISNHIHMQVNRFFPTERKIMEELVYFQLYKRLGKVIYCAKDDGK